jgi:predicted dehydrogenase/Fe-S-cluster-containing hydrogenase component 2
MGIRIREHKCTGCSICVKKCPFGAIQVVNKKASILDTCNMCRACVDVCKFGAILAIDDESTTKNALDPADYADIWVFAEQKEGKVLEVVFELLGEGRRLADKSGQKLCAILLGHEISEQAVELVYFGADKVYVFDNEQLGAYQDDLYSTAITELIRERRPSVVLFGASSTGRSLAPRLAARIDTGLTADCTGLDIDEQTGNLLQTRPAFGGNIMATIECPNHRPQMATVRPKVMTAMQRDMSRTGEIVRRNLDSTNIDIKTVVLEEARKMVDAAKRTGKKLTIGYQSRYRADSQHLKRLCDAGELGNVYFAKALAVRRRAVPTWGSFLNEKAQGGGPLIDIGTHALDLTLWLTNNYKPVSVMGATYRELADTENAANAWGSWDPKEFTVEDSAFGFVKFENGMTVILESSWALNTLQIGEAMCVLCGDKAGADMLDGLRINGERFSDLYVTKPSFEGAGVAFNDASATKDPAEIEARQWIESIRNDTQPLVKPEEALVVTEILEAIYESAKTGKAVYFD